MNHQELTAMAVLRSGRSFIEASQVSRLDVERVMELWEILARNEKR